MVKTATLTIRAALCGILITLVACTREVPPIPRLHWYVFDEPSGAFAEAAQNCTRESNGRYDIVLALLPSDADQQREQVVRRLAARDAGVDIIAMDVIWTAEFAEASWIRPWEGEHARRAQAGRLGSAIESASYRQQLWAAPFTTNAQLLWYRTDRIRIPPATWDEMIQMAERLGERGTIVTQGERYEGLTVFFVALLASAGGSVLSPDSRSVSLEAEPTRRALEIMRRLATSPAADPALSTAREDQARRGFESGHASFMLNYTYVWPSARANAPEIAKHMSWARWPAVIRGKPSRVTIGGVNLGIGAYSRHPALAFEAAACLASAPHQRLAAARGGLPPTIAALYDDEAIRKTFPFAEALRASLRDAVQRPQTPLYADVSLAIAHTLHPMRAIDPVKDTERLRKAVGRALRSEGLL
ncbi:MAG: ABC transporter substrate-binding protein [Gammaproteobacteria bacterium]|nr:ABC transporter substrate-binding protein [Gammaproteobacteria bacterium]MDH3406192.1 ABC transporter substrate-binding protein [Gammaproteobacteria bacterium]MDH5487539.1 ABC transporter substrate-binding protein [Gammaproteobacteria bacterium]